MNGSGDPRYPSVQVGFRTMFEDSQGNLHPTPQGAVSENMRVESDQSRGASGGCGQDIELVSNEPASSDETSK